jgi:transmembrane sensor
MDAKRKDDWRLAEEAASWLIRMEEDDSLACRTEFVAWAKASPRHLEELLFAQALWREFAHIDPLRQIDLQELPTANEESVVALNVTGDPSSFHLPAREEPPRARKRWVAIAACVVAIGAVALGWLIVTETPSQLYSTAREDQSRPVKMSDGSVMYLNADTRASVQFSDSIRQVQLLSGEAFFVVEQALARPFIVITDDATIQAVGTEFNVLRQATVTRVSVVDGVVEIEAGRGAMRALTRHPSFQLAAGNQADVSNGQVVPVSSPDVKRAVAWHTRLVFRGNALDEVAAEFNRRSKIQIRLEGDEVRTRKVSGVFDADDPQPLIDFLAEDPALEFIRNGDEILIRLRKGR